MRGLTSIRLVALDIDGVALHDTFSPIIYNLAKRWGKEYTRDLERNVFSQPRMKAARYMIDSFGLDLTETELLDLYFQERKRYLETESGGQVEGLEDFLHLCKEMNLPVICYGGLDKTHFDEKMGNLAHFFEGEKYISTDSFRPGIKEIVTEYYRFHYSEVIFIDDVNKVAEEAKKFDVPFIGIPSSFEYGFQKFDMKQTGVKFILNSIRDLTEDVLRNVDEENRLGRIWK
ncbi:MAG TPA: hypothetical protein PL048_15155 [Leptospiraceae bacterium]|nr:hypothetical protein [Leptospiraceae bacterium]HMY70128.1 hypothetical protein [Leptospiraceae bacterium]HMZ60112.1 hypothetical protein [Leptospiraceae bacterium]HNF12020.1 hypothetical protein [Leptospiraceae bacterium]HNF25716.1 hypothetical protein [Leptospiraceae bacterium]